MDPRVLPGHNDRNRMRPVRISATSGALVEDDDAQELGQRERSKRDKYRRIAAAARAVFLEKGFEGATTREIAAQAGVSVGSVFVYATDKRDLLLMVVNDDLDAVTEAGQAWAERPGPLLERLCGFFGDRYRYWGREPALSRPTLQQTYDMMAEPPQGPASAQMQRFLQRGHTTLTQITTMVLQAQASGEADPALPAERVASLFASLYVGEVRRWLKQPDPDVRAGVKQLREMLALVMRGVAARD